MQREFVQACVCTSINEKIFSRFFKKTAVLLHVVTSHLVPPRPLDQCCCPMHAGIRNRNCCSPHLCVVFLFLVLYPAVRPPPVVRLAHTQLVITPLAHTPLVITLLVITPLAHTQLAHTQLVITLLAHTQLVHTQLVCVCSHATCHHTTCSHTTCHHTTCHHTTCSHTQLAHTQLVITLLAHTQLVHTQLAPRRFAWQAWHFVTSTFTLRGRRGTS